MKQTKHKYKYAVMFALKNRNGSVKSPVLRATVALDWSSQWLPQLHSSALQLSRNTGFAKSIIGIME